MVASASRRLVTEASLDGLAAGKVTTSGSATKTALDGQYAPTSHTHAASAIVTGTVAPARLGTGTASASTFLRGDGTWQTPSGASTPVPYVYLDTPSGTDDTAAIQSALDSFDNTPMPGVNFQNSSGTFQAGTQANGGGTVVLGPGVWIASTLVLGHRQRLLGSGWTTVLRQKSNTSGHLISNQRDSSIHAQYVEVANIQIDGNKANQTATNHGIYLLGDKANNYTSPLDEDYDVNNYLHHVYVRNFKGYGIYMDGSGENIVSDFKVLRCDAGGVYTFQDNYIVNGTIGWSGGHGMVVAGDDCRITNVKAWFSTMAGFYVTADSGCITGCSAQDNQRQGILLDGAFGINVSGFMADSNSRNNAGTYYQVDVYNSQFCVINALARNRYNANGPGTKGLQHAGTSDSNDIVFVGAASPWGVTTPYTGTKNASYIRVNGVAQ